MHKSVVYVKMSDDDFDCSYAIVEKSKKSVIVILKELECFIFDYEEFLDNKFTYLLLKHYPDATFAYKDFLKLIGKMCKKGEDGKYFSKHIDEDNDMVFIDDKNEHMISGKEKEKYLDRENYLINYIKENKNKFVKGE